MHSLGHVYSAIVTVCWWFIELTLEVRAIDQYTCTVIDKEALQCTIYIFERDLCKISQ